MAKQLLHLASAEWAEVLNCLVQKKPLPEKYRDHALIGNWQLAIGKGLGTVM